jgi:hypothetical protein
VKAVWGDAIGADGSGGKGHGMRYWGVAWDCVDGKTAYQPADGHGVSACQNPPLPQPNLSLEQDTVDYGSMDSERDFVAENATRSIFGWLRVNGYASDEKDIWNHEWFDMSESDEEIQSEDGLRDRSKSPSYVEAWIAGLSHEL